MVFFDTIQTTFLLALLMEVLQNNERLGIISLMSLIPPAVMCMPGSVFAEKSSYRFRVVHLVITVGMVAFYELMNQAGIQRPMISAGTGGIDKILPNSQIAVHRGIIDHRAALGANVKNITLLDGGDSRIKLMEMLRAR